MGERGSEAFRKSLNTLEGRTWFNRVWDAVKDAFKAVMRRMGADVDSADLRRIDRMKPMDAVDFIVKQMLSGKSLASPQAQTAQGAEGGTRSAIARQNPNGLQGIDRYGIISGTQNNQQKEIGNGVSVQGHRVSEQGNRDGLGGESEAVERGDSLLAGASAVGRGVEGRVSESTRVRDKEAESQTRLVDYAKENGVWDGNVEQTLDKRYGTDEGQKNTDGGEAVVLFDRKRGVAVKAIGLDYYGSPTLALERVELHNKYFPDTKLTLVGFGKIPDVIGKNGEVELYGRPFNLVVEQPLIDSTRELTKGEIRSRLEAQGFKFLKDRGNSGLDMETPDGKAIVSDLHERNVFSGSQGAIKVIDCDIRYKERAAQNSASASPAIRQSRRAAPGAAGLAPQGATEQAVPSAPATEAPPRSAIMDRERTRGNRLRERWQDSRAEIAAVQKETGVAKEAVDARGHTDAANSTDFYAAKDKENGYVQAGLNSLQHVRSAIDETLAAAGIPLKFFDKYLIAKHAEERNRTIAQALFAAERIRLGLGTECPGFYFTSMPTMRGLSTTSLGAIFAMRSFAAVTSP